MKQQVENPEKENQEKESPVQSRKINKSPKSRCVRCGSKTYKNSIYCSRCLKSDYLRNYLKKKRKSKEKYTVCQSCKSEENVMPYVGLCKSCYRCFRPLREKKREEQNAR